MLARLTRPVRHLHDLALYRIWCHPERGILKRCHADPYKQHGLGNLPICAACKRPLSKRTP